MQGNNYSDNWQQIKRVIKAEEMSGTENCLAFYSPSCCATFLAFFIAFARSRLFAFSIAVQKVQTRFPISQLPKEKS